VFAAGERAFRITCRSALAREEAGTSSTFIDRHYAFASKPAYRDVASASTRAGGAVPGSLD
jgi:hypothetical protein